MLSRFAGYRPLQTIKGCINSLFYLHNETINILTHGECDKFDLEMHLFTSLGKTQTIAEMHRRSAVAPFAFVNNVATLNNKKYSEIIILFGRKKS